MPHQLISYSLLYVQMEKFDTIHYEGMVTEVDWFPQNG